MEHSRFELADRFSVTHVIVAERKHCGAWACTRMLNLAFCCYCCCCVVSAPSLNNADALLSTLVYYLFCFLFSIIHDQQSCSCAAQPQGPHISSYLWSLLLRRLQRCAWWICFSDRQWVLSSAESVSSLLYCHQDICFFYICNKLCAWRHNVPLPPASLTIISCKYENRKRLQFTTEFAKRQTTTTTRKISTVLIYQFCADTVKAKHSTADYGPIKQIDLWPSDLESDVRGTCDVGYLCANFSLPRPLCSRLRPILLLVAEFAVTPQHDVTRRNQSASSGRRIRLSAKIK